MPSKRTHDPIRDLMGVMAEHAQDAVASLLPVFTQGEVLTLDDPEGGIVVQCDSVGVPVEDVTMMAHVDAAVGDRVYVMIQNQEAFIMGVTQKSSLVLPPFLNSEIFATSSVLGTMRVDVASLLGNIIALGTPVAKLGAAYYLKSTVFGLSTPAANLSVTRVNIILVGSLGGQSLITQSSLSVSGPLVGSIFAQGNFSFAPVLKLNEPLAGAPAGITAISLSNVAIDRGVAGSSAGITSENLNILGLGKPLAGSVLGVTSETLSELDVDRKMIGSSAGITSETLNVLGLAKPMGTNSTGGVGSITNANLTLGGSTVTTPTDYGPTSAVTTTSSLGAPTWDFLVSTAGTIRRSDTSALVSLNGQEFTSGTILIRSDNPGTVRTLNAGLLANFRVSNGSIIFRELAFNDSAANFEVRDSSASISIDFQGCSGVLRHYRTVSFQGVGIRLTSSASGIYCGAPNPTTSWGWQGLGRNSPGLIMENFTAHSSATGGPALSFEKALNCVIGGFDPGTQSSPAGLPLTALQWFGSSKTDVQDCYVGTSSPGGITSYVDAQPGNYRIWAGVSKRNGLKGCLFPNTTGSRPEKPVWMQQSNGTLPGAETAVNTTNAGCVAEHFVMQDCLAVNLVNATLRNGATAAAAFEVDRTVYDPATLLTLWTPGDPGQSWPNGAKRFVDPKRASGPIGPRPTTNATQKASGSNFKNKDTYDVTWVGTTGITTAKDGVMEIFSLAYDTGNPAGLPAPPGQSATQIMVDGSGSATVFQHAAAAKEASQMVVVGTVNVSTTTPTTLPVTAPGGGTADFSQWKLPIPGIVGAAASGSVIQITTSANHGLATGNKVVVRGVGGMGAANGNWTVTKVNATQVTLNGSTPSGTYTSGGTIRPGTPITGASGSPISISSTGHGYNTADVVEISEVGGNTNANGTFSVTKVNNNTFTLDGTTSGPSGYTSGGIVSPLAEEQIRTNHAETGIGPCPGGTDYHDAVEIGLPFYRSLTYTGYDIGASAFTGVKLIPGPTGTGPVGLPSEAIRVVSGVVETFYPHGLITGDHINLAIPGVPALNVSNQAVTKVDAYKFDTGIASSWGGGTTPGSVTPVTVYNYGLEGAVLNFNLVSGNTLDSTEASNYGTLFNNAQINIGSGVHARFVGCDFRDVNLSCADATCIVELIDCYHPVTPIPGRYSYYRVMNGLPGRYDDYSQALYPRTLAGLNEILPGESLWLIQGGVFTGTHGDIVPGRYATGSVAYETFFNHGDDSGVATPGGGNSRQGIPGTWPNLNPGVHGDITQTTDRTTIKMVNCINSTVGHSTRFSKMNTNYQKWSTDLPSAGVDTLIAATGSTGTVYTLTFAHTKHNFNTGDTAFISGGNASINGNHLVTVVSNTVITLNGTVWNANQNVTVEHAVHITDPGMFRCDILIAKHLDISDWTRQSPILSKGNVSINFSGSQILGSMDYSFIIHDCRLENTPGAVGAWLMSPIGSSLSTIDYGSPNRNVWVNYCLTSAIPGDTATASAVDNNA